MKCDDFLSIECNEMNNQFAKLGDIEKLLGMTGDCPVCLGNGLEGGSVMIEPGDPVPPPDNVCPRCGQAGPPMSVIIVHRGSSHEQDH